MHVAIAGAHGQIARHLTRRLVAEGHAVTGIVRNAAHTDDIAADGARPVVLDLESASASDLSAEIAGAEAVVFAAGAGPNGGLARKQTVDRGAAVLLADAAQQVGARRYLLVSSMGVESVRQGATPEGVDEVFVAYLRAKLAAEDDVTSRDLDWTVLRPGRLTDDPATGGVTLAPSVERGDVPRDDVAAVLAALLDAPGTAGQVLELTGGGTPVSRAVDESVTGQGRLDP